MKRKLAIALFGCLSIATVLLWGGNPIRTWQGMLIERQAQHVLDKADDWFHLAENYYADYRQLWRDRTSIGELDAGLFKARYAHGKYYVLCGDHLQKFKDHMTRYPKDDHMRFQYAWFLLRCGLRYQAAEQWAYLASTANNATAINNLASLFNHMGRDREAMQLYRRAIEIEPDNWLFHLNLATSYFLHRQHAIDLYDWGLPEIWDRTIKEYETALALTKKGSPEHMDVARQLASTFIMSPFFSIPRESTADAEIKAWQYYISLNPGPEQHSFALTRIGLVYLKVKRDVVRGAQMFRKAYELDSNSTTEQCLQMTDGRD